MIFILRRNKIDFVPYTLLMNSQLKFSCKIKLQQFESKLTIRLKKIKIGLNLDFELNLSSVD